MCLEMLMKRKIYTYVVFNSLTIKVRTIYFVNI